jgi:hypothetical protein
MSAPIFKRKSTNLPDCLLSTAHISAVPQLSTALILTSTIKSTMESFPAHSSTSTRSSVSACSSMSASIFKHMSTTCSIACSQPPTSAPCFPQRSTVLVSAPIFKSKSTTCPIAWSQLPKSAMCFANDPQRLYILPNRQGRQPHDHLSTALEGSHPLPFEL